MTTQGPSLFFFVDGEFLIHSCQLVDGECYGDFINYSYSHMDIWDKLYAKKYDVDFDYYPRGRIVYRKTDGTCFIYYDKCIENAIWQISSHFEWFKTELDEHYQCNRCNPDYVS